MRLRYFEYEHLPPGLQEISKPFHDLAHLLISKSNAFTGRREHEYALIGKEIDLEELDVSLRKLLEAKDAAIRAFLDTK